MNHAIRIVAAVLVGLLVVVALVIAITATAVFLTSLAVLRHLGR